MPSPLGPIPVTVVKKLRDRSGRLLGKYHPQERLIELEAKMSQPVAEQVLWHEWLHSVLFDAGVQLTREQTESVCDSVGTALATFYNH